MTTTLVEVTKEITFVKVGGFKTYYFNKGYYVRYYDEPWKLLEV